MKRRDFILTATAASATLAMPGIANAFVGQAYSKNAVKKALANGETVFLDFYTDWCTTCAAQGRTITALVRANPAYKEHITFIKVDWDLHKKSSLARSLKIPRRSTLVALKGDRELGRIVAGTSKKDIKALLDTALGAAMA